MLQPGQQFESNACAAIAAEVRRSASIKGEKGLAYKGLGVSWGRCWCPLVPEGDGRAGRVGLSG